MSSAEIKDRILASKKNDIQKLKEIFDIDKEEIKSNNVQLYYAILGVVDYGKRYGLIELNATAIDIEGFIGSLKLI